MENNHDTLEDLLCYLKCARESLLTIHCAIEHRAINERITLDALFATYNHLEFITKRMEQHIERVPYDVLLKVAEEVARTQEQCANIVTPDI